MQYMTLQRREGMKEICQCFFGVQVVLTNLQMFKLQYFQFIPHKLPFLAIVFAESRKVIDIKVAFLQDPSH